jgi:Tfp pilus assembly protein PilV
MADRLRVVVGVIAHDDRGFSLIEALIAGGLLAAGILALGELLVVSSRAAMAARQMTFAATLAAGKVEELRARQRPAGEGGRERLGEYTRTWQVAPAGASAVLIRVSVEPGGVRLAMLDARLGP